MYDSGSYLFSCILLRIESLIWSVYWSINIRWRVTNCVNLRSVAELLIITEVFTKIILNRYLAADDRFEWH